MFVVCLSLLILIRMDLNNFDRNDSFMNIDPNKFQNKYRIASTRLQNWNYGWNAAYFVTICTKGKDWYFGEVENGEMKLSNAGIIANLLWFEIKNHAKNIELGEFVVMPNHVHGILILKGNALDDQKNTNNHINSNGPYDSFGPNVETRHALSLHSANPPQTPGQQRFQNQGRNTLSSIVGSYKSAVTKHCNNLSLNFGWHPRFHDHIIRDEKSFQRISQYIINNPKKWKKDRFFK
jgi:putative transposase